MTGQLDAADVEILVHVTAPSRVSDDVTYRRLADAYLSFVPDSRAHVAGPIPDSSAQQQQQSSSSTSRRRPVAGSVHEDDRHDDGRVSWQPSLCADSQDMSFRSVLDNRSSPRPCGDGGCGGRPRQATPSSPRRIASAAEDVGRRLSAPRETVADDDDDDDVPSEIADSYPMPDLALFNVTPTRVLQRYIGDGVRTSVRPMAAAAAAATCCSPTPSGDVGGGPPPKTELSSPGSGVFSTLPAGQAGAAAAKEAYGLAQREKIIPVTPHLSGMMERKRKAVEDDDDDVHETVIWDTTTTHASSSMPGGGASDAAAAAAARLLEQASPSLKRPRQATTTTTATVRESVAIAQRTDKIPDGVADTTRTRPTKPQTPLPPSSASSSVPPAPAPAALPRPPSAATTHALSAPAISPTTSSSSLSIRPPSPPIGVASLSLSSLVSPKLAKLARDLSSRYRPTTPTAAASSATTTTTTTTTTTPTATAAGTAAAALDPLERGYWLVDCSRWPAAARADAWAFLDSYVGSGLAGWGVWCRRGADHASIRLYGWAHVAKHTYLLLYLASGRRVRASGARWVDAQGRVALEVMPSDKA